MPNKKKINVLLTGATGCIGRNIIDRVGSNFRIHAFHRDSSDTREIKSLGVNCIPVNLESLDQIDAGLFKIVYNYGPIDSVVHLASDLTHNPSKREDQFRFNVESTIKLSESYSIISSLFSRPEKPQFIYTSTGATRKLDGLSQNEIEKYPCGYIASKKLAELTLEKYFTHGRMKTTILRPGIVIGKHDRNNYSQLFKTIKDRSLTKAFPGSLPFCNAKNVADAHINLITNYHNGTLSPKNMYYLGGSYLSWNNIFNRIADTVNAEVFSKSYSLFEINLLIYGMRIISYLRGKESMMYHSMIDLMMKETKDFPKESYILSEKDLDYSRFTKKNSIGEAIKDCYSDLVSKGKL